MIRFLVVSFFGGFLERFSKSSGNQMIRLSVAFSSLLSGFQSLLEIE